MCVNAGVTGGAGEVLVFSVRYVLVCARITVLLGQAEVDDINEIAFLAQSHQEVVRLYIPVNEVFRMYVFNTAYLKS